MIKRIIEILAVGTTHVLLQFAIIFVMTDGFIMLAIFGSTFWLRALPYIVLNYIFVAFLLPILIRRIYEGTAKKLFYLQIFLVPALCGIIGLGLIFICANILELDMYLSYKNWFATALIISIIILVGEAFAILTRKLLLSFFNWVENVKP